MKRPVKGYEGYYEVSDSGDVYRIGKQNKAGNLNSVLHNRGCRNSTSGYHFEFC